ncbi:MAG: hypothetical protein II739_04220 [Clostridia bacterium]|nr:hypothetical protein [Clostridia bacterium]
MTEIPVYVFTGFLGAGKTTFIQKTLEDARFNDGTSTLVLQCEDGEEELDESRFANKKAVHLEKIDDQEALTEYYLADLLRKYRAKKVLVEYNGMWLFQKFLEAMPDGWMIYQEATFADCSDYLVYNANMRSLVGDKLKNADMIIFNNFKEGMDRMPFHKVVRSVSKRCNIIYNYGDRMEPDDIEDPLPFDVNAPVIDIADTDYGVWYADLNGKEKEYEGKTVHFKGLVAKAGKLPPNMFVIGRHIMTCCAADIVYGGLACRWTGVNALKHLDWVEITAKMTLEKTRIYNNDVGPILNIISCQKCEKPDPEVVSLGG